jgi:transmembrane sensor
MTLDNEPSEDTLTRVQAEAAAWMALLHSPERNAAVEAGLKNWIGADPLHAATWETATDVWSETEGLPRRIPRQQRVREKSFRRPVIAAVAATAVLGLVGVGLYVKEYIRSGVTTAVGEQRTLNLDDGTRVELNTDSRLWVHFDKQQRTVVLKSGEAYFQIAHETRPFVVIAGNRKIEALGTAFTVRREAASDDAVTVTLIEGRVAVAPVNTDTASTVATTTPTILNAGQRLRTRPHAKPSVDNPSIEKATGWMRGQLIFDHTPLKDAAAEFNRYNKLKIVVALPETSQIAIGGIFRIGDSRSFARAVAASYDLKVTAHEDELVLEPAEAGSASPEAGSSSP